MVYRSDCHYANLFHKKTVILLSGSYDSIRNSRSFQDMFYFVIFKYFSKFKGFKTHYTDVNLSNIICWLQIIFPYCEVEQNANTTQTYLNRCSSIKSNYMYYLQCFLVGFVLSMFSSQAYTHTLYFSSKCQNSFQCSPISTQGLPLRTRIWNHK